MEKEFTPLFQGIDTIIIRVSNIEISKRWYQEALGLPLIWEDPNIKLVVLDTSGPTSLTLWQTDGKIENKSGTAAYPIFKTPNAQKVRLLLEEKGVQVEKLTEDEGVCYFSFYDPDGNALEACQVLS